MMRDIERRLQKLESQVPPPKPTEEEEAKAEALQSLRHFLFCAVAYYLGDPTPKGSVTDAYSRALGYSHGFEFRKAVDANDPDLSERHRLAMIKLLEKFGVNQESEWEEKVRAFNRMEAGFSEHYKKVALKI